MMLDKETDINQVCVCVWVGVSYLILNSTKSIQYQVTEYFSYEHFYVLYCKFFELDNDHDMLIDKYDLVRYSDHSLTFRVVERIFDGM